MASTSLADLTPETRVLVDKLISTANGEGIPTSVASTLRSCSDQGPGGVVMVLGQPAHRNGYCRSWHLWGRAADIMIPGAAKDDARYDRLGEIAESLGLVWGGRWSGNAREPWHVQASAGYSVDAHEACPDDTSLAACEAALAKGLPAPGQKPAVPPFKANWGPFILGGLIGWYGVTYARNA